MKKSKWKFNPSHEEGTSEDNTEKWMTELIQHYSAVRKQRKDGKLHEWI